MTPNLDSVLEPLVGEWRMIAAFKDIPPAGAGAHVSFAFAGEAISHPALGRSDS